MTDLGGPSVEADLQWDTTSAFSLNSDTPWDILRAQLLWAIWRQRVAHAFDNEHFHLGLVLWHAWRNTIYCAIEAYKELHRHKRNEEKRREQIECFQQIWTANQIFGRLRGDEIKWNLTPHQDFLPQALEAWTATPIRVHRLSPSPDPEAEFAAQPNFQAQVQDFLNDIGANWQPPGSERRSPSPQPDPAVPPEPSHSQPDHPCVTTEKKERITCRTELMAQPQGAPLQSRLLAHLQSPRTPRRQVSGVLTPSLFTQAKECSTSRSTAVLLHLHTTRTLIPNFAITGEVYTHERHLPADPKFAAYTALIAREGDQINPLGLTHIQIDLITHSPNLTVHGSMRALHTT
jgi:hypothetical protein